MTRSNNDYTTAIALIGQGLNDCEVARATGIPRGTVRDWRSGRVRQGRMDSRDACRDCGHPKHDFDSLPFGSYAYLLGMYLGDGHIDQMARTWRLRISLDMAYGESSLGAGWR